jgi:hypothetical protein
MTTYQKFALVLASNYPGTSFHLDGCLLDAEKVRSFLVVQRGFDARNIATLYDRQMTKSAIYQAFDALVTRSNSIAASGQVPAFFLHYSGHGTRVANTNTRQFRPPPDGYNDSRGDDALVPQDVVSSGLILDDDINERLVQRLHPTTQLFALTDCCNSGSDMDLSYQGLSKVESSGDAAPSIIHVAACRDSQLAAETSTGGGAATSRFLQVMAKNPQNVPELRQLLGDLSTARNAQEPQVSVSKAALIQGSLFPWMIAGPSAPLTVKYPQAAPQTVSQAEPPATHLQPKKSFPQRITMTITMTRELLQKYLTP